MSFVERFTRSVALTAAASAAAGGALVMGTAGPASAAPSCPSGAVCLWEHNFGGGARATFSGNNTWFGRFAKSTGGNWNDVASSAFNNGTSGMGVNLYRHANYDGRGGSFCVARGVYVDRLGVYGWNDQFSSNLWTWSCHR